jgi:RND family efflux transporter MFP subunit
MAQDVTMLKLTRGRAASRHFLFAAACGLSLIGAACDDKSKGKAKAPPPPPEVVVAEVKQETIPIIMPFSGSVKAVRVVNIVPRVSGYVDKRNFQEGTFVKKGDPLYVIDPRPFQTTLDGAQSQLKRTRASAVFWENERDRYTRLAKSGAGSKEDKEKAVARYAEAVASIAKDKADVESARLNLEYTNVTAPFDGRVEQTRVHTGANVERQKTVMTTLVELNPIYVVFNLSRRQGAEIQALQKAGLAPEKLEAFEASVTLPNGDPYPHKGHLDFASAQVNPNTDTLTVRAIFPNDAKKPNEIALIPGQYVPLDLVAGHQPDAVLIPQRALVQSEIGTHVFVLVKDDKVELRRVKVDRGYDQQWVIAMGLKKGEKVVVDGVQKIRSGMTVKIKTNKATG